jgi:glycosyltransferase involved in cell wall biosynthesis
VRLGIDAWGLSGDLLYSGMGQYACRLMSSLASSATDLELVAYAGPEEPRPDWLPAEVAWRPVGRRLPGKLTAMHSRLMAIPPAVRADGIDVYHSPAVHMRPFFPPVPHPGCKLVATIHDLIPMNYYDVRTLPLRQRLFYPWNLRRALAADTVLTVSEASRQEITDGLGLRPNRVRVIPNGIDFVPNRDRGPLDRLGVKAPYVLYAGSYEPRKNFGRAVAAFAALAKQGLPHRLVALVEPRSGHAAAALSELERLDLGERIVLLHSLDEVTLRSLYTHAEALFFPSLAEGFGYPPLQAGSCGVAVVASDLPAVREVMADAALYVDPLDVDAMADALGRLLIDHDRRRHLGALGTARGKLFSQSAWAAAHLEVYRELATRAEAVPALT